jgi:hypothetical protein
MLAAKAGETDRAALKALIGNWRLLMIFYNEIEH